MLPSKLLRDKKPDIGDADFFQMLKKLSPESLDWKLFATDHALQLMTYSWNDIVSQLKRKVIHLIMTQSCNDLKKKFTFSVTDERALQDAHDWHNSVDGAVEVETSWRSTHVHFYDKNFGLSLIEDMKADYVIHHEDES